MGYNGSGTFNLTFNWENDAANGIDITASRFDTQEGDIAANGLSICVTRDGQGVPTADIPWGANKITNLANGTNAQDAVAYSQLTASTGALTGFLGGLTLSTAGSSGTFGIAAGIASDSTSALSLVLSSAFTKTTSSWVAGTAAGGLDAGSIANTTWYHVFIIGSPAVTADILFSLSPTAPTLPGAYTLFRRIGAMKTDASAHWIQFIQIGNNFSLLTQAVDATAVSTGTTSAQTITLSVPTGIVVLANFSVVLNASGSNSQALYISSLSQTDVAPNISTLTPLSQYTYSLNVFSSGIHSTYTNTSAQIRFRFSAADGQYYINTTGWIDTRGQG